MNRFTISVHGSTSSIGTGLSSGLNSQKAAQRRESRLLPVDQVGVFVIELLVFLARRLLELGDGQRIEQVDLAVAPPLVVAAGIEIEIAGDADGRECPRMPLLRFRRNLGDADALHAGRGRREILVDHLPAQADRLEILRAAIALKRRDAHLGHDLQQTLVDRLDVVFDGGPDVVHFRQPAIGNHVRQRLERHIRIDRAGAVADQRGEMMNLARLAALDDQPAVCALAFSDEMMVDAGRRQQSRNRRLFFGRAAVRKNEQRVAVVDRARCGGAQFIHGSFKAGAVVRDLVEHRQSDGAKVVRVRFAELLQLFVGQDRLVEPELAAVFRSFLEQVLLRTDGGDQGGDQFLADRVERRIRDLREQLLEIVVEKLGAR